jgi:hypothetical protein
MSNQEAINLVVQHFLREQEAPAKAVGDALCQLAHQQSFEALGRAVLVAMLEKDMAKLETNRTVLIAKLPSQGPLQ